MTILTQQTLQNTVFLLVLTVWITGCSYQNENVVPELVLDVPDEIKPEIRNIILRVVAEDMFPIEVDLTRQNEEFIIPTGKKRSITAIVLDAKQAIRATGWTVNNISPRENQVTLNLHIPPSAPVLSQGADRSRGLQLNWTGYVPQAGRKFSQYRVYRDNFEKVTEASVLVVTIDDQGDTTMVDKDVVRGQDYYYRVYVFEESGAFNISNSVHVLWQDTEKQPAAI